MPSEKTPPPNNLKTIFLVGLLVVAAGVVYANSLDVPFLFDDHTQILKNTRIQNLQAFAEIFRNTNRPVLDFTFAINYAVGKTNVFGYHLLNVLIHVLAALVLLAIVVRTLRLPRLTRRYDSSSITIGGLVAVIWLVHPLQTESVTYITQRAESLMGLFYFLTFYGALRSMENPQDKRWGIAAIGACVLGMGTKEVMVTAPLVILLYDKIVVGNSFKKIFRERGWLYVGLAMTWIFLFFWEMTPRHDIPTAGFNVPGMTPWQYALTQPQVIFHYVRLAVWPDALCLDYDWPLVKSWGASLIPSALTGFLLFLTVWAWRRNFPLAFAGIWFFLILAPTSSVIPIKDVAFEHRLYLSLAGLIVAVVLAGEFFINRLAVSASAKKIILWGLAVGVVFSLGWRTMVRNKDYATEISIWKNVVEKRPENARAQFNLGLAFALQNQRNDAMAHLREAVRCKPDYPEAYYNMGLIFIQQGRWKESIAPLQQAIALRDNYAEAHNNLGSAWLQLGNAAQAREHFLKAVQFDPQQAPAYNNLGILAINEHRREEAIADFLKSVQANPNQPQTYYNLALSSLEIGKFADAIQYATMAIAREPQNARYHYLLAKAYLQAKSFPEAEKYFLQTLRLQPGFKAAQHGLDDVRAQAKAVEKNPIANVK